MKNIVTYTTINGGHSLGQELEYLLVNQEGLVQEEYVLQEIVRKVFYELNIKKRGHNSPNIYVDGYQVEICSSPHQDIFKLYSEMAELNEALQLTVQNEGLKAIKSAYCKTSSFDLGIRVYCSANQVHIGAKKLQRKKLRDAIIAYLPLFIALGNNSPTKQFLNGSRRLIDGVWSNKLYSCFSSARGWLREADRVGAMVYIHHKVPTVEVRCMDRSKTLEEDIANATFIFATSEMIKEEGLRRNVLDIFRKKIKNSITYNFFMNLFLSPETNDYMLLLDKTIDDAKKYGFDAEIESDNGSSISLREIAMIHYKRLSDIFHRINTPKNILDTLERKLEK